MAEKRFEEQRVERMIAKVFNSVADGLETGQFGKRVRVALALHGSEHGIENGLAGAYLAQKRHPDIEVVLIGPKVETALSLYEAEDACAQNMLMETLLDSGDIDACVTMHYDFPVGVSTVGRVITPGSGKEMLIATTTGTSSTHRVESMVRNALHGISVAEALGIPDPKVGILNVDGARQTERALRTLSENGLPIVFAESMREDGGAVMRGNDLLSGTPDIMVADSLTGNLLMKLFSAYTTGGSYESLGFGYGPGVGYGYHRTILILSRASGVPVVANAIAYGADLARGALAKRSDAVFKSARSAGLDAIIEELNRPKEAVEQVSAPPAEVVTEAISGIDILELEEAVQVLWKQGIYAESGMGCTGPMIRVSTANLARAEALLSEAGYC